jgi:hypothetical protein
MISLRSGRAACTSRPHSHSQVALFRAKLMIRPGIRAQRNEGLLLVITEKNNSTGLMRAHQGYAHSKKRNLLCAPRQGVG